MKNQFTSACLNTLSTATGSLTDPDSFADVWNALDVEEGLSDRQDRMDSRQEVKKAKFGRKAHRKNPLSSK